MNFKHAKLLRLNSFKLSLSSFLIFSILVITSCSQTAPVNQNSDQNLAPEAVFTASVDSGVAPLVVDFDAAESKDDQGIRNYSWDFGEGSSMTGMQAQYTFESVGSYRVTLTVRDIEGLQSEAYLDISVLPNDNTSPPAPFPSPQPEPNQPDPNQPNPSEPDPADPTILVEGKELVAAGVFIPTEKEMFEDHTAELGIEAVVFATGQNAGQLTTTGTITQSNAGFTYQTTPNDRLRIVFQDGNEVVYFIEALDGDLNAPDIPTFFRKPHVFRYRVVTQQGSDVAISLQKNQSSYDNSVIGTLKYPTATFEVNLNTTGTYSNSADGAVSYSSQEQTTGTIVSEQFSASINEAESFRYFQFENAVEQNERLINNSWTINGDQYQLSNGRIYRGFINGKPTSVEVQGSLSRNDVTIGGLIGEETDISYDVYLIADGEKTSLYSHNKKD